MQMLRRVLLRVVQSGALEHVRKVQVRRKRCLPCLESNADQVWDLHFSVHGRLCERCSEEIDDDPDDW